MNYSANSPLGRIRIQQWLALPLSVALGGLLLALLFVGLRPGAAVAAEAAVYSCDQAGLNAALATGGSATFSCGGPTTVIITNGPKLVSQNVSLDGGDKLILSGGNVTGVFTVAVGVHLSLLNLTVRDALQFIGGGVYNNGFLDVTHSHFISNSAAAGGSVFNAPGGTAAISGSSFERNVGEGGAVWNGAINFSNTTPATMTVINSAFLSNTAGIGAAIFNQAGPLNVSGSIFMENLASSGGAIVNFSTLHLDSSHFFFNRAGPFGIDSQAQSIGQAAGLELPAGLIFPSGIGGAIYASPDAVSIISTSSFTENFSMSGGGAIFFGALPPSSLGSTSSNLAIAGSQFAHNCTGGPGGALATSMTATVSDSTFSSNFADSSGTPCLAGATSHPGTTAPAVGQASGPAIVTSTVAGQGGAVFNSGTLTVAGSSFLGNATDLTATGGGGAISNYFGSGLNIQNSIFTDNQAQEDGGAIFNAGNTTLGIYNSDFTRNTATDDSGGAIANLGALTVNNSNFTANSGAPAHGNLKGGGGAIFSTQPPIVNGPSGPNEPAGQGAERPSTAAPQGIILARLTVDHSSFVSNSAEFEGGAIDASNTKVTASSFTSNTAEFGGAIDVFDTGFVISGSTFIGNSAITTTHGGARQGGAIDTNDVIVSILNSTFYHNHAEGLAQGGAINNDNKTVYITNSTFLSNTADTAGLGGAFAQAGAIVLRDTLVAFNGSENCDSAVTLSGMNLEYPLTTCGGASVQANPLAQAPANNGGPTLTSALLPGSPAINAGDNSGCPGVDQRGAIRPVGPNCDIGAFEFGGQVPWLWLPVIRK